MTDSDIQRLEALCEKATPGPWRVDAGARQSTAWVEAGTQSEPMTIADCDVLRRTRGRRSPRPLADQCDRDADFIAAARTALPAALAEIRRLKALVKSAESQGSSGMYGEPACPWCGADLSAKEPHGVTGRPCPAFTPDGSVK